MRRARFVASAALVAGLALATFPAWRVVVLGVRPTIDELLALRCSAPVAKRADADAGPRAPVPGAGRTADADPARDR